MDGSSITLARPSETEFGHPSALSQTARIIEFYEDAGTDYVHWSRGLNMHLGFYRWGMNPFDRETMLEQLNLEIADRLRLDRDQAAFLVDLGCGMGASARAVAGCLPRAIVKGITLSPSQVNIASEANLEGGYQKQIEILEGDYTCLPFADRTVDGAWALESACYAAGPAKADLIREVARVLKPGARFVVADCFIKRPDVEMSYFFRKCYSRVCKDWALSEMATIEHFVEALKKYGFRDLAIEDISWRVAPSLAHAPVAVGTFLAKKLIAGRPLKRHSVNNLEASLLAMILGANRSKIGYCLISCTRS